MSRLRLVFATLAIVVLLTAAPAAHGWPLDRLLHLHPATNPSKDISFELLNGRAVVQNVAVGDRTLSLLPNSKVAVSAPVGTRVTSTSEHPGNQTPDVLFAVQAPMRHTTVVIH